MKILKTAALCVLLSLCYASVSAQVNALTSQSHLQKRKMFSDLPQRMALNDLSFTSLLQKEVGEKISFQVASGFMFQGVVVSKSDARDIHSKTVVIKSTNRQGAALTLTGISKNDGTYSYSGRMLSMKHSDAYEIVEAGGQYAFEKKSLNDLVSE